VTDIVSFPPGTVPAVNFIAGDRIQDREFQSLRIVVLQVSVHLFDQLRVVRPVLVQPEYGNRSGRPRPVTASLTQSRIGASFVWHIRKISPSSTFCSSTVAPEASTARIVPFPGAWNVLS